VPKKMGEHFECSNDDQIDWTSIFLARRETKLHFNNNMYMK